MKMKLIACYLRKTIPNIFHIPYVHVFTPDFLVKFLKGKQENDKITTASSKTLQKRKSLAIIL